MAYGERQAVHSTYHSKWPQIYISKFYKPKDSSDTKSITLGVDAIHACSVALGILKAMENSPARDYFVNWVTHDAIKASIEHWKNFEVTRDPVAEALHKAQKDEQKAKEKVAAARKKVEQLKKTLIKYKRSSKP